MKIKKKVLEELSDLEHTQWMSWAKDIAKTEKITSERLNDGKVDPNYEVDFTKFQNTLLTTDDNGLKKIPTKIFDIREV